MNAHISIDQIVVSWLGKHGYTMHWYIKALLLAQEAVQKLSLKSMPMLHHRLLTKEDGENWFTLPEGYADYVRIGVRYGDTWIPVRVDGRLMPYPNSDGLGDLDENEFGDDLNTEGGNASWYSGASNPADFSSSDFSGTDFQTETATAAAVPATGDWRSYVVDGWYGGTLYQRRGVAIDTARGLIVTPYAFGHNELYLVYTGIDTVDNMTGIPVIAQAAIEAYIDWRYEAYKRNPLLWKVREAKDHFDNEHRDLRALVQRWSIEDVVNAFEGRFAEAYMFLQQGSTTNTDVAVASSGPGFPYTFPFSLP